MRAENINSSNSGERKKYSGQDLLKALPSTPTDAAALTETTPISVPDKPTTPNYSSVLTAATSPVQAEKMPQKTSFEDAQASMQDTFKQYLEGQKAPPNLASINSKLERQAGIEKKQQLVNTYQGQLNTIVNKAQADILSTQGQGRGIPEAIIGGQQAQRSCNPSTSYPSTFIFCTRRPTDSTVTCR